MEYVGRSMRTHRRATRFHPTWSVKLTALVLSFLVLGSNSCVQNQEEPDEAITPDAGGTAGAGGTSPSCDKGVAEAMSSRCSDGCDNDDNGKADCDDVNCCAVQASCGPATYCGQQGEGNPWDGSLDFNDAQLAAIDPGDIPSGVRPCRAPWLVRVDYTIDGDTFEVTDANGGASDRVRVIGVDTPEIDHTGVGTSDCYGDEAAYFTRQLTDHLVWLTFDAECRDTYDRMLAYVYIGPGKNDSLERQLLRRGFARAYPYGGNRTFEQLFDSDETEARAASTGLWSACQ